MLRRQAGTSTMQACFLPGRPLTLAAAGGDGAVHLLDLSRPGKPHPYPNPTPDLNLKLLPLIAAAPCSRTTIHC